MLINVQQSSILVTSLEEYRTKPPGEATPYAVITLYPDMAASKDLILIRAEMMDVNVAIPQLQQIWYLIKHFYIQDIELFTTFPEAFNRKPNPTFEFDEYIKVCKEYVSQLKLENTKNQLDETSSAAAGEFDVAPAAAAGVQEAEVEQKKD